MNAFVEKLILHLIILPNIFATSFLLAQDALIWTPNNTGQSSAQALESALSANGRSSQISSSLPGLSTYDYVFVCLGLYPDHYELQNGDDVDALIDYLNSGGYLYMEGGDTWARDFPTDLHPYFGIRGEADGQGDLSTVTGAGCLQGLQFRYGGAQQYVDHLAPEDGAAVFFNNESPAYACGVAYDSGYRTLGVSFEFGGLTDGGDTKNDLMAEILDFFDNGCALQKPAPLHLHAYSGYDGAVPLMWDAPPGQVALGADAAAAPHLAFSQEESSPKSKDKARAPVSGDAVSAYQTDTYHVYRSTSESGPFERIAIYVNRQYYRDTQVTNGTTYYYKVSSLYDSEEGEASTVVSATPAKDGNRLVSPWLSQTPTLDGEISAGEWENAATLDIRNADATEAVTLYAFNNNDYIYLAVDHPQNTTLNVDDQLGIYVDEDRNHEWYDSGLFYEGTFWYVWNGSDLDPWLRLLDGWWPLQVEWGDAASHSKSSSAMSAGSGRVQYEIQYDLTTPELLGDNGWPLGLFLYALDMPDSTYDAVWPQPVLNTAWSDAWLAPVLYGTLVLSPEDDCSQISESQMVDQSGTYTFNQPGDGHAVDIAMNSVTGSGNVTVTQYNCAYPDLPGADPLDLYWDIQAEPGITEYSADYTFHYTDDDAAGFEETEAYWGIAWFNETSSTWQWQGGSIDAAANTVTITGTDKQGVFVLYRRIFGDVSGDGYVDLDDFQRFGDVWNDTSDGEFPDGSDARFFNCGKSTNDAGEQIIDLDDYQVFGDVWNNGIAP